MRKSVFDRVLAAASYIIDTGATVREASRALGIPKSTLHSDVHTRLERIDREMFNKVKRILDYNYSVRHIRGGASTRALYLKKSAHLCED